MTTRELVLLTNQYPYDSGDVTFIRNEIDALAKAFDSVVIFNYTAGPAQKLVDMPANVRYGGNLFKRSRAAQIRAIFRLGNITNLVRVFRTERQGELTRSTYRKLATASILGMTLANDPRVRAVTASSGAETTVYSFWGMGAGLMVPWLPSALSRVFVRLHRYDLYEDGGKYLPYRRSLFARATRLFTISADGERYLAQHYPETAGKVNILRLGSSAPSPVATSPSGQVQTNSFAGVTLVSCSYVTSIKRVSRIADVVERLAVNGPLRWIHFGDGPEIGALREQVSKVTNANVVVELRGATPNAEVLDFYARTAVDLFINVSSSEGVPVSIMEAISFDIPVVATDVGGTREIVDPLLRTGELIPAEFTDDQLIEAMERVLGSGAGSYEPHNSWAALYDSSANAAKTARALLESH